MKLRTKICNLLCPTAYGVALANCSRYSSGAIDDLAILIWLAITLPIALIAFHYTSYAEF